MIITCRFADMAGRQVLLYMQVDQDVRNYIGEIEVSASSGPT